MACRSFEPFRKAFILPSGSPHKDYLQSLIVKGSEPVDRRQMPAYSRYLRLGYDTLAV